MPLSEFLRMAKGKVESGLQNSCPTSFYTRAEDDLVELVWENGQIVMQGQSTRVIKNPTLHSSPSNNTPKFLNAVTNSRIGNLDSILNDISDVVPSAGDLDLSQDDDMVPWLNYPVHDALPHYCAESFHEISGVTANGLSTQNSFALKDKKSSCNQDSSNLMNFSHFSRPATIGERMEVKGKGLMFSGSNPIRSRLVDQSSATQAGANESFSAERPGNLCREISTKNENPQIRDKSIADANKEPTVASSVGSGNSGDRISCDQAHNSKRKFCDIDESDWHGDDIDSESADVKKTTGHGCNGSKRGRAAEVHNLSERRRRDRINEKMHALQELIPNCNKYMELCNLSLSNDLLVFINTYQGDKASMLNEAIEYLKTLQIQVQMMSMGAGLCIPPMMFPSVIFPSHSPHISPMGFGMGMGIGMGFGMGMSDINGGSYSYPPINPLPPMQGPHFPSPMSGHTNFPRISNPNLPMYAHHPSQGLHLAPNLLLTGQTPVNLPIGALQTGSQSEPNKNPQLMDNAEAKSSINHSSHQQQTTNGVLDKSAVIQENKTR